MTDSQLLHILQLLVNLLPFIYLKPENASPFKWSQPLSVSHYRVTLHLLRPSAREKAVIPVLVPEVYLTWLTQNHKLIT